MWQLMKILVDHNDEAILTNEIVFMFLYSN